MYEWMTVQYLSKCRYYLKIKSAARAVAQATAQGFKNRKPELWAFLSLDNGPRRPGFGTAGPGWLTALGQARHITTCGR
jgi:hypothetical protein